MQQLNWLDYAIIIIIFLSTVISLIRGFIREALSLAAWIIAFWASLTFSNVFSEKLEPYIHSNSLRYIAAFFIIFIIILIIGVFINFIITRLIEKTGLSGTDRLLGVIFGFARGVLLIAIILLAAKMTSFTNESVWAKSRLVPQFTSIENWLVKYVPKDLQKNFKNAYLGSKSAKEIMVIKKATSDTKMLNQQRNQ